MTSAEFAAKVAADGAASFALQRMIQVASERDVLDALIDSEALATYCRLRAAEAGLLDVHAPRAFETITVVVGMEGGLFAGASADRENIEVILMDYDTDGATDEDGLRHDLPQPNGETAEGFIWDDGAVFNPEWVTACKRYLVSMMGEEEGAAQSPRV